MYVARFDLRLASEPMLSHTLPLGKGHSELAVESEA